MSVTGFSLIEILIALSVFSIGAVSILGLMTVILKSSKQSWQETRTTQIVRQIMSDLGSGKGEAGYIVKGTNASGRYLVDEIPLTKLTQAYVTTIWYDAEGLPLGTGDGAASAEARFEAQVSISVDGSRTNLNRVQIRIVPNETSRTAFSGGGGTASGTTPSPETSTGAGGDGSLPKGCQTFFSKLSPPAMETPTATVGGAATASN